MIRILIAGILASFALEGFAETADRSAFEKQLSRQVKAAVEKAVRCPHPRLFGNEAVFRAIRHDISTKKVSAAVWRSVQGDADRLVGLPPVERKVVGPRMLGSASEVFSRILRLAMAYRLSSDQRYLEQAEAEMINACGYGDWNPRHFLDTATMCLGMAIGYDWLYGKLNAVKRERIRQGMIRLGMAPCEAGGSWQRRVTNWGQVCNAGIIAVALALMDSDRSRAVALLTRAVSDIRPAMSAYAPKGAYPEGPGYWGYGTLYNVYAIAMLESALGSDFGLCESPGFSETCSFLEFATGPSGKMLNYSDSGEGRRCEAAVWWFAKRFNRPDLLMNFEYPHFTEAVVKGGGGASPFMLFWLQDVPDGCRVELPLSWDSGGWNPFAVHRSGWDRNAVFAAIKAGKPSYPHGHQDSGSFWLDAGGVRWVSDLGYNDYHRAEVSLGGLFDAGQNGNRWKIFRLGVGGHSTLTIDGCDQDVNGTARVVSVSEGPESKIVIDMSANYPMAKSVIRTGKILRGGRSYRISDSLAGVRAGAVVKWQFVTRAEVSDIEGDILLTSQGKRMRVRKKLKEASSDWTVVRDPKNFDWEDDNTGVSVVSFTTKVPKGGALDLAVGFLLLTSTEDLSDSIQNPQGLSIVNIRYCQRFYDLYSDLPNLQQVVEDWVSIPWGHHSRIIDECKDPEGSAPRGVI